MVKNKNKEIEKLKKALDALKDDYMKTTISKNEAVNYSIDT